MLHEGGLEVVDVAEILDGVVVGLGHVLVVDQGEDDAAEVVGGGDVPAAQDRGGEGGGVGLWRGGGGVVGGGVGGGWGGGRGGHGGSLGGGGRGVLKSCGRVFPATSMLSCARPAAAFSGRMGRRATSAVYSAWV